jgi:carboxymethylenebutenolidase
MSKGKFIELVASDGHRFVAWESTPAGEARGSVVIVPEIFGVNSHIRSVADGYASEGYHAIAPALFDRVQRNYEAGYSADEVQAGIALMNQIDIDSALTDVKACVEQGKRVGKVAVIGYCWGGTVAWVAAARVPGIACAVPYYGGGIPDFAAEQPECPVLLHFGEQDKKPSPEEARKVVEAHPSTTAHFYPAGHGFNCDQRGSYDAESSRLAGQRTLAFLAEHLD